MTAINQKEYLKKYLGFGKGSGVKRKKIKSEKIIGRSLKIIDDDINANLSKEIQDDLANSNEDAPQIVAVIDDRPPSLRIDEETKDNLWKPIGQVIDSINNTEDVKFSNFRINKEASKVELNLMKTGSSKIKQIISPSRIGKKEKDDRDNDYSPVRRSRKDESQARKMNRHETFHPNNPSEDFSPCRKYTSIKDENVTYPDLCSQRDIYPQMSRSTQDTSSNRGDLSKEQIIYSSRRSERGDSITTRVKIEQDDISPPRKSKSKVNSSPLSGTHKINEKSSHNLKGNHLSPPRKVRYQDNSPPRKSRRVDNSSSLSRTLQDEYLSSQQRENKERISRWNRNTPTRSEYNDNSSEETMHYTEKMEKTLSGKKSGLQNAKHLVQEIMTLKQKEEELFENMSNEVSGQNALTVSRKKKTTTPEEDGKKRIKDREMEVKYSRWGKGMKQEQDSIEKNESMLHEMNKPLARYADDEDLEKYLKEQERDGDPMLAYIRKKKRNKQIEAGVPDKPTYMGDFEPNRFGIQPGYRWDGVDRSNGYEKKLFESRNSKRAAEEEAMKWSTEDM